MPETDHFFNAAQFKGSDSFILIFESQVLVRGESFLWNRQELSNFSVEEAECLFVERRENVAILVVNLQEDISVALQAELNTLRSLLLSLPQDEFILVGRACQLIEWYNTHRFCGKCGNETEIHPKERAIVCVGCLHHYFPRINPCVIVLIMKGEQMLLARSSRTGSNFFSCLAGFIEIGETPEEAVKREVKEEVGFNVANIRYIKSQSWPFPSQLMLGFLAEYSSGEITLEPSEIAEADWYDIDSLPNVPSAKISISGELIEHCIAEIKGRVRG